MNPLNDLGEFELPDEGEEARRADVYATIRAIDPRKCGVREKREKAWRTCGCGRRFAPLDPEERVCPICRRST